MTVSRRTLKILAAVVWYVGGVVLFLKAGSLLVEANALRPGAHWLLFAVAAGALIGGVKARFIFNRSCRKNLARIDALSDPRIWLFFRPWFFFFLLLMIATGATLSRTAHGNYPFLIGVAVLDFAIGTALLASSYVFWRQKILVS
jgi:hypothetical protein